ncbi:MAG: C4-dicarboxylate ABC transporter permease [Lachnospiraceae bacterium]|nr:C4-dicarboxylate ABC transporter permease [Lachnospiraceae bacterium]
MSEQNTKTEKKRNGALLHPMLLLVIIVVLSALASYVVPAGQYERVMDEEIGREIVDPTSFTYLERTPVSVFDLLQSLTQGLQEGADVIFFLLIIGGMFSILNGTGALNVGMANLLRLLKGKEWMIIPIFMILFGCGSTFCGNFEEFLVFVPLIVACCITSGFDSLTAVGIIFLAATAGYGASITNTFTVGVAQQVCGLPQFSGMELRIALFAALEISAILFLLRYVRFIRKNPRLSGSYSQDQVYNQDKKLNLEKIPPFTPRQTLVLVVFGLGIVVAVWGVIAKGFYVNELSAIFLAVGILGGLVGGLLPGEICERFVRGCRDMLLPVLMIGLAHACIILLNRSNVLDTILHGMAGLLRSMPDGLMPIGMLLFHALFHIIVPSGSAHASITMPLMVSLADMGGTTRQTAVLAYQLGSSFTNILSPTGGEILAALAICHVPFGKWLRFILPLICIWYIISLVFLIIATQYGYGPM